MQQTQESTIGEPMYVESLMTLSEWNARLAKYPSSIKKFEDVNKNRTHPFKWRHRMGENLTPEQIVLINSRLDAIKKKAYGRGDNSKVEE